jgi:hypothetical protein
MGPAMAAGKFSVGERDLAGSPYADKSGRPIGEYQPSALERLNRLHDESVETARLANLLGRVPYAAVVLMLGYATVVIASLGAIPFITLALWGVFVAAAVIAMLRVRHQAITSAFDLLTLRAFALDLNAVMLYAGFAWGAGAFLGIPGTGEAASLAGFSLGGATLMGVVLRARGATLYFLIPSVLLASAAAFFGNAGLGATGLILASGLAIIAAVEIFERTTARRAYTPNLPSLTLS